MARRASLCLLRKSLGATLGGFGFPLWRRRCAGVRLSAWSWVGRPRAPGVGAAVSLGLHALVFALAILSVAPHPKAPVLPPIHFPLLPRGEAVARHTGVASTSLPPHRREVVRPRLTETLPSVPAVVADAPKASPDGTSGPGDSPPGGPTDGCQVPPCAQLGTGAGASTVLILGPEMTPPRLLSSPEPLYPAAALVQQLAGTVLVRCTVTDRGSVEGCSVLKSVPLLDEAALQAVTGRRYAPALYEGRPVSVWVSLSVRFVLP
jgi:protein TonB